MPRKNEKIVEQHFAIDLKKKNSIQKLPSRLRFLENVEFHSIAVCKTSTSIRRATRILMLPHQIKQLLEINALALTIPEVNRLTEEIECLKLEIKRHKAEMEIQKTEYSALEKNNQSLLKNLDELTGPEIDRAQSLNTNSARIDKAAHLLKGLPLQGGIPK